MLVFLSVCVLACVRERERGREWQTDRDRESKERERERCMLCGISRLVSHMFFVISIQN